MKTFDHIVDPGHGWIKCKKSLLEKLKIAGEVSEYSYMLGDYAYLEEDCDAGILFKTLQDVGIEFQLRERNCYNRYSRVRNYQTYKR